MRSVIIDGGPLSLETFEAIALGEAEVTLALGADAVERMGAFRRPLQDFAPKSPAAIAYARLWGEIKHRLALTDRRRTA